MFSQLHSLVITETMAKKFFGKDDPVGKTLKISNQDEYVISGVIEDLPKNSSFKFDWLAPFKVYEDQNTWLQNWGSNGIQTFVEVLPNANVDDINKKLYGYIQTKDAEAIARPFLFSINDWRLYNKFEQGKQVGGRIEYVRLFTTIAWIILIIACINFMNLATARSEKRAKEVGVRKVIGAGKGSLVAQFLSESLLMSFISVLLAIGILYLALPGFNKLVEKELIIDIFKPIHIAALIGIGLVCGLVAGSYPALYLSSFKPITVFKGLKIKGGTSAGMIRKGLVVTQFAISITLIIGTVIIYQQIQHVKNRQLGYNKENLIYLNMQGKMNEHFPAVHHDLLATGVVQNAAVSNQRVIQIGNNGDIFTWPGKDPNKKILITQEFVSPQYINTLGMQIKHGRDFYDDANKDTANIIINETFAELIGKENPVGEVLKYDNSDRKVVGVVKNFLYNDMYGKSAPIALFCQPTSVNFLAVRFKPNTDINAALSKVEGVLKTHNPGYPFEYKFLDEEFNKMFKSENLIGQLSKLFAILTIFISCLGLFGLAAYTAERRTKEIGIRKVLGATLQGITFLISKDFLKLVILASVIAFPLTWWMMSNWLQDFAYRVEISWVVFVIGAIGACIIALLTVSFQALKAALSNPIKSLRTE
jgi:ABC-type antimicrobial peptide transport system permease subunit